MKSPRSDPIAPAARAPRSAGPDAGTFALAAASLAVVVPLGLWQQHAGALRAEGSALFHGGAGLPGHLPGHTEILPASATRCSNCHEQLVLPPARSASTAAARPSAAGPGTYAAVLDGAALARPRPRRDGPPAAYDAGALCTLLRTGVDPARAAVAATMPRYDATDAQCDALWAHLAGR